MYNLKNGEYLLLPVPHFFRLECCDCGLTHLFTIEKERSKIRLTVFRDDASTDKTRKQEKIKVKFKKPR